MKKKLLALVAFLSLLPLYSCNEQTYKDVFDFNPNYIVVDYDSSVIDEAHLERKLSNVYVVLKEDNLEKKSK